MLHAMFQDHGTSGSGEEDVFFVVFLKITMYEHGGHLGHVTGTIYTTLVPASKGCSI